MIDIKKDGAYSRLENAGKNNFDTLRFLLAFTVFLVHASFLSGATSLQIIPRFLSSEFAVKSFFVVSGFLIFLSYENSHSLKDYLFKRLRRIYPGYVIVITASALLGFAISTYPRSFCFDTEILKYLASNLVFLNFLHPGLPGVFLENHVQAVNGAIWTLKIEVMFYLCVPMFVWLFNQVGRFSGMIFLFAISVIYSYMLLAIHNNEGGDYLLELRRQLPGQLTYFIVGAAGYYYFEYFKRFAKPILLFAILIFFFRADLPLTIFEPIALGVLVLYFATLFPYLGNFGKYGDFSYGIYILHFPVLQIFITYHLFGRSPLLAVLAAASTVMFLAVFLWNFVEKPFLQRNSHYVAG